MGNGEIFQQNTILHSEIEDKRKRLILLGKELGLTHQETVLNSQLLDELINEYIKSKSKERKDR
ncbi:aspartyl-phosphate phosphatase Spo0E family protein [Paucisalibacillus globulus]|jgi:Spo0E like sporulation regulatory protein|uniref:aspartyl-phosphate phosphatase Spo0E family protein n=1 Tax=Paucisalibacillus globulus TaxID=351095 RepID=UPI000BB74FA7|nr:aspartyl-phosphate phosphatase Spo0E family protein [Paucisalibacillus globulus]